MRIRGAATSTRCSQSGRRLFEPGRGLEVLELGIFPGALARSSRRPAWTSSARCKSMVLSPLGIEKSFIARTRADLQRSVFGGEDNFHPGWVAHGLLMGPPSDVVAFMHRLFTGALLPAPLLAAMRERHPVETELAGRPWRTAGYGLGVMIDIASPHGLCIGHSGQGPASVSAAYHFPDSRRRSPSRLSRRPTTRAWPSARCWRRPRGCAEWAAARAAHGDCRSAAVAARLRATRKASGGKCDAAGSLDTSVVSVGSARLRGAAAVRSRRAGPVSRQADQADRAAGAGQRDRHRRAHSGLRTWARSSARPSSSRTSRARPSPSASISWRRRRPTVTRWGSARSARCRSART